MDAAMDAQQEAKTEGSVDVGMEVKVEAPGPGRLRLTLIPPPRQTLPDNTLVQGGARR